MPYATVLNFSAGIFKISIADFIAQHKKCRYTLVLILGSQKCFRLKKKTGLKDFGLITSNPHVSCVECRVYRKL